MYASQAASPNPAGSPSKSRGSGEEAGSPVAAHYKTQPALNPLFVYGVKPEVRGGIYFSGDNATLLYPSGCGISLYDSKVHGEEVTRYSLREKDQKALGSKAKSRQRKAALSSRFRGSSDRVKFGYNFCNWEKHPFIPLSFVNISNITKISQNNLGSEAMLGTAGQQRSSPNGNLREQKQKVAGLRRAWRSSLCHRLRPYRSEEEENPAVRGIRQSRGHFAGLFARLKVPARPGGRSGL